MLAGWRPLGAFVLFSLSSLLGAEGQGQTPAGQVFNASTAFNQAGTVYRRGGSLLPQHFNLYNIPVPSNYSDPDILLTLNSTSGGTGLALYCNPQYGQFASATSSYPGPNYAVWYSDLTTPTNEVFISKNDEYYKSPTANESTPISFLCSVINNDVNTTTNYTLSANIVPSNRTLVSSEQSVLASLFTQCCSNTGACNFWKARNLNGTNANGGNIRTDFCSFPQQVCSPSGNLYRLNLASYNLTCDFPSDIFTSFSQLTYLNLGGNPLLSGNISTVAQTMANLTALQITDLSQDTGIEGSLNDDTVADNMCRSAQGGLVSLSLTGMGLNGSIPTCLYSNGSTIVNLDLSYNNLTGSLTDNIPTGSHLQVLSLNNNSLTGMMPATLSNAEYLTQLNTSSNMMTGDLPATVGGIETLAYFNAAVNNHTGAIPDSFGTALNLQVFDVKLNSLTAFPTAWTNPSYDAVNSSFQNIRTSFNKITGPFPSGLVNAQQLTYLILNENDISGPLPANSSMFPSLRALNVSANLLNGTLPTQFGQVAIFSPTPVYLSNGQPLQQVFDISFNRFTGSLPSFLSRAVVPSWTEGGIFLQGNSFNTSCSDNNFAYLDSYCPDGNQSTSNTQVELAPLPSPPSPIAQTPSQGSVFGLTPPSQTTSTQSSSQQESGSGGKGLSGGAIAGIVIGVLAALAVVAFLAFLAVRRRRTGSMMPRESGKPFSMPTFDSMSREPGRKLSLKKGFGSGENSGFERFNDEQGFVELSKNGSS